MIEVNNKPKIGISFSGGGARSVAQIGVIKALREHGIEADMVAGTSGGSIIGALYAAGKSVEEMLELAKEGSLFKLYKAVLPTSGLTSLDYLEKILSNYIEKDSFEDLKVPLHVIAADLMAGEKKVFSEGPLFKAVMASCAVPLIFKPVEIEGQLYVDGGIFENMPISPLLPSCDVIIGVNVIPNLPVEKKNIDSMISIGLRVFDLTIFANTNANIPLCDVIIEPKKVSQFGIFSFGHTEELFNFGYEEGLKKVGLVKESIERRKKQN